MSVTAAGDVVFTRPWRELEEAHATQGCGGLRARSFG
jgi:hypothetical protein